MRIFERWYFGLTLEISYYRVIIYLEGFWFLLEDLLTSFVLGAIFRTFKTKKNWNFVFSTLQIEKKLQKIWKNLQNFWNQKNENKNKNCFASSWAENRHQPTKSKNMDANNQQLNSKIWYEVAFWGLATSVGWLLLLKKNCWVGYFLNFFGGTT